MNNIIPFDFNTHPVRVINDNTGQPWFVAKDIAEVLGYSDAHKMTSKLDDDEIQNRHIGGFGNRGVNIINESGLYSVVLRSDKPEAKPFRKWITGEVLPSIRKTGSYSSDLPNMSSADEMIFNLAVKTLNPDPASKMTMLKKFGESRGMHMKFLPDYTESQGTHHSLSELLKVHQSSLSARKANSILIELGLLEVKTRQSKTKGIKEFKSVSEAGLKYGCNLVNPSNLNETQAHWFDKSFGELLKRINPPVQLSA